MADQLLSSLPVGPQQNAKQRLGFLPCVLMRIHRDRQANLTRPGGHVNCDDLTSTRAIHRHPNRHVPSPDLKGPVLVPTRSLWHSTPYRSLVRTFSIQKNSRLGIQPIADQPLTAAMVRVSELTAELHQPSNRVNSYLHRMPQSGHTQRAPFHGPDERPSVLWSLQAVPLE